MSAQKEPGDLGLDYDGPQPMDQVEFKELQQNLKQRQKQPKLFKRRREMQAAEAPAFLSDHFMAGYLHWVVKLAGENKISVLSSSNPATAAKK